MANRMACMVTLALLAASTADAQPVDGSGPTLTSYGRASVKIVGADGKVVYIDPYQGDYSEPADLILVTHGHSDHNAVLKVARKPGCKVAAPKGAVDGKLDIAAVEGEDFTVAGIMVRPVPASNKNHARGATLGYLVWIDGVLVYHASDTSKIPEMTALASLGIDWALLPCDGYWNMGPDEAAECAKLVGAKRSIPIHSSPRELFLAQNAERFAALAPGAIVVPVGRSLALGRRGRAVTD